MEVLIWIGFSQSFFEGLLIATKKGRTNSDKILSAWLFLLGISFLLVEIENQFFDNTLLTNSFLLLNPAFFLYIKSLTKPNFKLKWIQLTHLIPFLVFETIILRFGLSLSHTTLNFSQDKIAFTSVYVAIAILSWLVYNTMSIVMVHHHRKNLENELSHIDKNEKIGWLLFIAILYVCFCVLLILFGVAVFFSNMDLELTRKLTNYFFLFLVYLLGFYGLKQRNIFQATLPEKSTKYENSVLSHERKQEIKQTIVTLFEHNKVFLNPDLNMDTLSGLSSYPKHQITEVLNTEIGQSFFQFVNTYRVNEVKKRLEDKECKFSIEAIGFESGFNSKSSFFTTFKRFTGQTPLQYRVNNSSDDLTCSVKAKSSDE